MFEKIDYKHTLNASICSEERTAFSGVKLLKNKLLFRAKILESWSSSKEESRLPRKPINPIGVRL